MNENSEEISLNAGELAPFASLAKGDSIKVKIDGFRLQSDEQSGKKRGRVQVLMDVTFKEDAELTSFKQRVKFSKDSRACLSVGGNLSALLRKAVDVIGGKWDDEAEFTEQVAALHVLEGKVIRIERVEDGKMRKGAFKGNTVKRYNAFLLKDN